LSDVNWSNNLGSSTMKEITMPANLFLTLFQRAQSRWHLRHSIGELLSHSDDHLLDDIGLTRHQAERLVAEGSPDIPAPERPLPAASGTECAGNTC
jgi:uncharacterized protein YjiS (DUF1127 family)